MVVFWTFNLCDSFLGFFFEYHFIAFHISFWLDDAWSTGVTVYFWEILFLISLNVSA